MILKTQRRDFECQIIDDVKNLSCNSKTRINIKIIDNLPKEAYNKDAKRIKC